MAVEAKLEELGKVLSRLEQSLDRIEGKIASGPSSSSGGSSGAEKPFVAEWDRLVESTITPYLEVSKKLGGDIEQHSQIVSKAIKATRDLLVFASSNKSTPSALEPLSKAIGELKEFKDKNFKTKNPNHLATIAEGASAFAWVAEKLPAPFVGEMRGSSEFWSNRILKDFKGVDETQCSWVKHWNQFLKDLQVYVKNYHTTGLAWA